MRMNLHFQRAQLGLSKLRFQRGLLQFARAEIIIVKQRVRSDYDQRSDDEIDVKSVTEVSGIVISNCCELTSGRRCDGPKNGEEQGLMNRRKKNNRRHVYHQVPDAEAPELNAETAAKTKYERRENTPEIKQH